MRGESRWTWVSTAPAVAIRPSPGTMTVPVPTTTSMSSVVSGLPGAAPATIRPSRIPMLALMIPRTGSITTTFVTTTSQDSSVRTAFRPMPSRAVLANPVEQLEPSA